MASKSNHMEYSIWQYIQSSGLDSKALHMASEKRHMEYSIWSLFDAIWSTPCGHYFLPYGVLHVVILEFIFSRGLRANPMFRHFWSIFNTFPKCLLRTDLGLNLVNIVSESVYPQDMALEIKTMKTYKSPLMSWTRNMFSQI